MVVYFVATLITCIICTAFRNKRVKLKIGSQCSMDMEKVMSFLPLFLVAAFRYGIGNDYINIYIPMFEQVCNTGEISFNECGFGILQLAISWITHDYFWMFFVVSLIIMIMMWRGIYSYSSDVIFSICIFVFSGLYTGFFTIIRQAIAMSIFFASLAYLDRMKIKDKILLILLEMSFHTSAVILVPFYLLGKTKIKKGTIRILAVCPLVFLIPSVKYFIRGLLERTLVVYQFSRYFNSYWDNGNTLMSLIIINGVVLLFVTLIWNDECNTTINTTLYFLQLATFSTACLSGIIPVAARVIELFSVGQIALLPNVLKIRYGNRQIYFALKWTIIIVYLCTMIWQVHYWDGYEIASYHGIWER